MIVALSLVESTTMRENPISKEYLSFDGQWVLREMLIEENHSVMVNEAFFHAFKRKLCQYGRRCR